MSATVTAVPAAATTFAAPVQYVQGATVAAPVYVQGGAAVSYAAPSGVASGAYSYGAPVTYGTATVAGGMTQSASMPGMPILPPAPVAPNPMTMSPPVAPTPPQRLTAGIPTPAQIQQQKAGYAAALDKQLKEAIDTVNKETEIEKKMAQFNMEKNIAMYHMQVDEKLAESLAVADEQNTFAVLELKKASVERNMQLNNQANGLKLDYQLKALQTDFQTKWYAFEQEFAKNEGALEAKYAAQVAKANTGTTYAAPATVV